MISARLPAGVAVVLLAVVIAALGAGRSQAATIDVAIGDLWFCTPAFEFGECENDSLGTTIFVGDIVTWTKTTFMTHTVSECTDDTFSSCDDGFQSGLIGGPTGSFSKLFGHDDTFYYRCNLHPTQMRGRIVVIAQPTDRDGDTIIDELDPDDDNDGILDDDDDCPFLAGVPELNGCPPPGPPVAVGGTAGLLDADDTAPTASEPRSDNIGILAALAGVVGATLIAGGWYARRRVFE
ncbi:MAG: hypothetical protein IH957_00955 [Chloroflexi bacterium]|nr:hypothetical protein [Chloroflexota bacterium]